MRTSERTRMKQLCLIFSLLLMRTGVWCQAPAVNTCDSSLLSKQEYHNCRMDAAWNADLVITTNYITRLKTALLPEYRILRSKLVLPAPLQQALHSLKITYDTVLTRKTVSFLAHMDKNQNYVQPKAYLSSLLSLQTFRMYPDVYAVLLNDVHLFLAPVTSGPQMDNYKSLVEQVIRVIPAELNHYLEQVTHAFETDHQVLLKEGFMPLFRGTVLPEETKKYRIINFLLWNE
jgi:hypothetical protein